MTAFLGINRIIASNRRAIKSIARHGCISLFGFIAIYPLIWLIASSFKDESEIFVNAISLIPQKFTPGNYISGWAGFSGLSFSRFFFNSFIIAFISTLGSVLSSAVVAFGFARLSFVGSRFWFACMMLTIMLPMQVQIIPQYILFSNMNWINTILPLVVPSFFGHPFFIFLMMQFIRSLPKELDDAAEIDGCSRFGIFTRIILPLILPALVTSAIFSFYWSWDDFLGPLLYLNEPKLYTVSLALRVFSDPASATNWGGIFAMSTLSIMPILIIFLFFQKYIIEGISTTGLNR